MIRDATLSDEARTLIKRKFLAILEETGHVTESARKAGVHYTTIYRWRKDDAGFERAWDETKAKYGRRCPHCRQLWPNAKLAVDLRGADAAPA